MAATLCNLIALGCEKACEGTPSQAFKDKLRIISTRFTTLKGFKNATVEDMNGLKSVEGEPSFKPLTPKEAKTIQAFQDEIDLQKNIIQNFIKILTKDFVRKQIIMLSKITIDKFNANPLLCKALNLKTPEEFVRYYAYQSIGRSMVTSMGSLVQNLLLYSNESVFEGKNYDSGVNTKFDLVIDRLGEVKSFLEIKSGFNDMDKGQIIHYAAELRKVEEAGHKGYLGIAYGKKYDSTVTAGLLRTYVPNWEEKTLVGKELWDFVSENENYHAILIDNIDSVASALLENVSIVKKIEEKIEGLIKL